MKELQYQDFLRLFAIHRPVQLLQSHIKEAEQHNNYTGEPFLEKIASKYPHCSTAPTSGYVLPGSILPGRFRTHLFKRATGAKGYGDVNGLVDEIYCSAWEHGNKFSPSKRIFLLWHHCCGEKEVYIVDEGEIEFDLQERVAIREQFVGSFGKDLLSSTDMLYGRTKDFGYFSIRDNGKKKGTLVRMLLKDHFLQERNAERQVCDYIGHELLRD